MSIHAGSSLLKNAPLWGVAKDHLCVTREQRQQCGDGQREREEGLAGGDKVGEVETSAIVSTIKIKEKSTTLANDVDDGGHDT